MENNNILLMIFLILSCFTILGSQSSACSFISYNKVAYDRRCFWVIRDQSSMTRNGADSACSEYGTLANIDNEEHYDLVLDFIKDDIGPDFVDSLFLGMNWDPVDQSLSNYDGSIANLPQSVWYPGFPRDYDGERNPLKQLLISVDTRNNEPSGLYIVKETAKMSSALCETSDRCKVLNHDVESQDISCPNPTPGLTCRIDCKSGYIYQDGLKSVKFTCQEDLTWDKEVSACKLIECVALDRSFEGKPGNVLCTGKKFQDTCTFYCDYGRELKGPRTRTCMEDGLWSDIQPTCEDIVCDPIDFPADRVKITCTNDWNYGSDCSFYCKSGLERWGPKEVTCLWNGKWSDGVPTCKKYDPKCPDAHKHGSSCPDTNCEVNKDCNDKDKICCPTKCGTAVCWKKPKRTIPTELLHLLLLGRLGNRGNRCSTTNCLVNACQVTSCPSNLGAQCRTTCNGCQANFDDFNKDITRQCRCPHRYPPFPGCTQLQCSQYRCITNYYTSQYYDPNIQCRMSTCGGCFPQFYDLSGKRIICRQILQFVANPVTKLATVGQSTVIGK